MGRVYQRGGKWWVQYRYRGQLFRESSGSEKQGKAVNLLKKRLAEMAQGRLVGPTVERTTFEDLAAMLIEDYTVNGRKSLDRAKLSVKHLGNVFARSLALDITTDRVSKYICSRMEEAKPATIRLEIAALKRMFTLGLRAGKVAMRPYFPSIEVRNTRTGFFERDQLLAVVRNLPEEAQPVVLFLYLSGWRKGEALPLQWRQVDFAAGVVRLEPGTTKNDEGRTLPFGAAPDLAELLRQQRELTTRIEHETGQIVPWVFHRRGKPIRGFREAWQAACIAAGCPNRLLHDLRRTAVRNFERAGVSRSVAMKLSGHKTESIYRRYAIVSETDLAEGMRKVAALHAADAPLGRRLESRTAD